VVNDSVVGASGIETSGLSVSLPKHDVGCTGWHGPGRVSNGSSAGERLEPDEEPGPVRRQWSPCRVASFAEAR